MIKLLYQIINNPNNKNIINHEDFYLFESSLLNYNETINKKKQQLFLLIIEAKKM